MSTVLATSSLMRRQIPSGSGQLDTPAVRGRARWTNEQDRQFTVSKWEMRGGLQCIYMTIKEALVPGLAFGDLAIRLVAPPFFSR